MTYKFENESAFQSQVLELAKMFGWLCYHTYDSRRCVRGFPDLVLVRSGRLIFAELKRHDGRLTGEQEVWLERLGKCGVETYVWRPDDLQEIADVLSLAGRFKAGRAKKNIKISKNERRNEIC